MGRGPAGPIIVSGEKPQPGPTHQISWMLGRIPARPGPSQVKGFMARPDLAHLSFQIGPAHDNSWLISLSFRFTTPPLLHIERDAWSMVKRLKQATNEHAPPPLLVRLHVNFREFYEFSFHPIRLLLSSACGFVALAGSSLPRHTPPADESTFSFHIPCSLLPRWRFALSFSPLS